MNNCLFSIAVTLLAVQGAFCNCNTQTYSLVQTPGCPVDTSFTIPFALKSTTPDQTNCDATKTVCATSTASGSIVRFSGKVDAATTSITIGDGTKTAKLPVLIKVANQEVADPLVGIFPNAGTLTDANALTFTVPIESATIAPLTNFIAGTVGTDCTGGNLCFNVNGKTVRIWGAILNFDKVTVTGAGSSSVVIPLYKREASNDELPTPLALIAPVGGTIPKVEDVKVTFITTTVTATGGALTNTATCAANQFCYQIVQTLLAQLKGVQPPNVVTFTFTGNNAGEVIYYKFNGAVRYIGSSLLSLAVVLIVGNSM